ncbi:hypothetical protein P2318_21285 [Myxococcaceae bacterium GXIMD 01537]
MLASSLLVLLHLGAAPKAPAPSTSEVLHAQCRAWAADPGNPWALAHGVTMGGRAFKTRDGREAADAIIAGFLRKDAAPGGQGLYFDTFTPDGTPVEPHAALQVKTLVNAGYPLSRKFQASWGPVTLGDLVNDLQRDFRPQVALQPDGAWTLDALTRVLSPGATFQNGEGHAVSIDAVMEDALATLERDHAELAAALKAGRPEVPKRKQGIYAHPCGGFHFFQAVASWARHPSVRKAWGKRLDAQVDVLLYRVGSESRQYEAALAGAPQYKLQVLVQMTKFYGHFLEALGRYRQENGWRPTPAQQRTVDEARAKLDAAVSQLQAMGALRDMASIQKQQPQVYLDLIGDACHAAHGLDLWAKKAP